MANSRRWPTRSVAHPSAAACRYHRSPTVVPSIRIEGTTVGLRGGYGPVSGNGPPKRRRASLWGRGRDEGADHFGDILPAVDVLAGANPNGRAGSRHAMPRNVKLGDVAPAVGRGWQQPQEGEVLHAADASADRGGALHQRVLGRRAGDAELERNLAARVGRHHFGHGVGAEDRLGGEERRCLKTCTPDTPGSLRVA